MSQFGENFEELKEGDCVFLSPGGYVANRHR